VPVQNLIKWRGQYSAAASWQDQGKFSWCFQKLISVKGGSTREIDGPTETKPDVGIGTETTRRVWNGYGNFAV
jgi:hypothetical protein